MTALATFLATAKRIEGLLSEVSIARDTPERRASLARSVDIRAFSWSSPEAQSQAIEAAAQIRTKLVDEYRAEGEAARDARLAEIAAELTALRAVLPQQAAAVAIELGHQARMLQREANGGTL